MGDELRERKMEGERGRDEREKITRRIGWGEGKGEANLEKGEGRRRTGEREKIRLESRKREDE